MAAALKLVLRKGIVAIGAVRGLPARSRIELSSLTASVKVPSPAALTVTEYEAPLPVTWVTLPARTPVVVSLKSVVSTPVTASVKVTANVRLLALLGEPVGAVRTIDCTSGSTLSIIHE